jgi:hypothetical protein
MDVTRALEQIAEIHQQVAKAEVYRGFRSLPLAASALIGLAAGWLQPNVDGPGFITFWTAVGAAAGFVAASELIYNYIVHDHDGARRRTRLVVGQFVPAVAAGMVLTAAIAHLDGSLASLLPGLWAICFGLGIFSSRPYLPRASGWVAAFYGAAGAVLLWQSHAAGALGGWRVGATFGIGQLLGAGVLYWNLERHEPGNPGEAS